MAKVIIVGGGIVGAACAYEASSRGADVVLADAALAGRATSAGAGIISPWSAHADDPELHAFTTAAAREYPALVGRLTESGASDVSYRKVGALYLCDDAETTSRVYERLRQQSQAAPETGAVSVLSGASARDLFPPLRVDDSNAANDSNAGVYVPGAARIDGRLMSAALLKAAAAQGAVIREAPARLLIRGGAARGIEVAGETIEGDAVVVAAGAWTSSVLKNAVLENSASGNSASESAASESSASESAASGNVVPENSAVAKVTPQRGQIAHISLPGTDTSDWPVLLPVGTGHYLLAFDDSRVVAGATRETGAGFDFSVTPGGLAEVLNEALRVAPGLATGTYIETRIGFRPASPDGRPLLGPVPGIDGLVVATGLGAEGLTAGPYTGATAARLALGLPPGTDLTPFDPVRLLGTPGGMLVGMGRKDGQGETSEGDACHGIT